MGYEMSFISYYPAINHYIMLLWFLNTIDSAASKWLQFCYLSQIGSKNMKEKNIFLEIINLKFFLYKI